MATDFDPYGILQVPPSARQEQIDEAYRKQYAAHGSDQSPDIRLREIQAAYRILSDPEERRQYDERRSRGPAPTAVAEQPLADLRDTNPVIHSRVIELLMAGDHKLVRESSSEAELIRRKPFSWFWAIFWALFGVIPLLFYLAYHSSRARRLVRLTINADGTLQETSTEFHQSGVVDPDEVAWTLKDVVRGVLLIIGVCMVWIVLFSIAAVLIAGGADSIDQDANALTAQLLLSVLFDATAVTGVWWFTIRKYGLSWRALGFRKPVQGYLWLPFAVFVAAVVLQGIYGSVLNAFGVNPDPDLPDPVYENAIPLAILIITTTIVAPIAEETFFRGFIFAGLRRNLGVIWAAVVSGGLFGLVHAGNPGYIAFLPMIAIIGAMFALTYNYSKSLYSTIMAHFFFNVFAIIVTLAQR
jgi:uncharacterized protein